MINQIKKIFAELGLPVCDKYLTFQIQSHPDYPSLIAIKDCLEELGINAYACTGTKDELIKENRPFLAHLNLGGGDIRYFKNVKDAEKKVKDFDKYWSGNVMFVDRPEKYGNAAHDKLYKKERLNKIFSTIVVLLFAGGILGFALYTNSITSFLFIALSLIGVYFSWLIAQKELGIQNSVSDKICNLAKHSRCESVLFSKGAKLFNWLTWGDVGMVYFSSSLLFLLICQLTGQAINFFYIISMAGLLFPLYSIYYQWRIVKQWCMLCLGVLLVLLLSGTISFYLVQKHGLQFPEYLSILLFLGIIVFTIAAWQLLKSLFQQSHESLSNEIKAARLRRNPKIFNALLDKQEFNKNNLPSVDEAIRFGNPAALLQLVIACNPFCSPCAKAHHAIEKLYEQHPDKFFIAIRFALNSIDIKDKKTNAATKIIQAAIQKPLEAIRGWYQLMSIDKFNERHTPNEADVSKAIEQHIAWSKEAAISATPTLFVNGRRLPELYNWMDFVEIAVYELEQ